MEVRAPSAGVKRAETRDSLLLAQSYPDPTAPYGSAYWGTPAADTRAREVVGVAESNPEPFAFAARVRFDYTQY